MPALQARMVSAIAVGGGTPEAGARLLDGMERTAARRRWRAALVIA
jgi:hypothetical protein